MEDKVILNNKIKNCIKGIIYGQCLGDAVGLITEFKHKKDKIPVVFPYTEKIRGFPVCDWTDDSDQMILLLETILESDHDFYDHAFTEKDIINFCTKLLNWKNNGFTELGDIQGMGIGGTTSLILNEPDFLKDPVNTAKNVWIMGHRKMAPNGALMRTSILSILNIYKYLKNPNELCTEFYKNIKSLCIVTHYDIRCIVSCWVLCFILQNLILKSINPSFNITDLKKRSFNLIKIISKTLSTDHNPHSEIITNSRIRRVPNEFANLDFFTEDGNYLLLDELFYYYNTNLKDLNLDENRTIGYTYKCLGCALWIVDIISKFDNENQTKKLDIKKIIITLVSEGGDADTNASVAGSVLGAYVGYDNLPEDWVNSLPNKHWLDKKIDLLFTKMGLNS